MNNDILNSYNKYTDHLVAKTLRIGILLMVITAIANWLKIFIIDMNYMMFIVGISIFIFSIPTLLFDVLHQYKLWARLLVLGLTALISGMMYAVLSYHVTAMFLVPVCIACLYDNKRYPMFTMVITIPILVASHFMAFYLKVVTDEPLVTLKGVICYGIIPRIIQYIGCSLICIAAADRSHQLIDRLLRAKYKQDKVQEILKQIIYESEQLMSIRHQDEMIKQSVLAVKHLLGQLDDQTTDQAAFSAGYLVSAERNEYCIFSGKDTEQAKCSYDDGMETYEFCGKQIPFKLLPKHSNEIMIKDHILSLRFYEDEKLAAFILIQCSLTEKTETMNYLRMLYTNIERSLKNVKLNTDMLNMQKQLIQSLSEICESKSAQTGQHIKRVGEYMKVMGRSMGLTEEKCETLCMAAMLHDVGKLKVPDEILDKKGKLTQEEFEEIKKHVHTGRQLLANCPGEMMEIGRVIAYQHHEKWDGTGYLKYKETDIDPYAALVAVIDVFDALVSKRSYKEAWDTEEAYQEIINCSGTHFSPQAVEVFKRTYPQLIDILKTYPD